MSSSAHIYRGETACDNTLDYIKTIAFVKKRGYLEFRPVASCEIQAVPQSENKQMEIVTSMQGFRGIHVYKHKRTGRVGRVLLFKNTETDEAPVDIMTESKVNPDWDLSRSSSVIHENGRMRAVKVKYSVSTVGGVAAMDNVEFEFSKMPRTTILPSFSDIKIPRTYAMFGGGVFLALLLIIVVLINRPCRKQTTTVNSRRRQNSPLIPELPEATSL